MEKNRYTYEVYPKKTGNGMIPLHIVSIEHSFLHAFAVFNSAKGANNYIKHEKARLYAHTGETMKYDYDMKLPEKLLSVYLSAESGIFTKRENRQLYIGK
jgi:hypothetical protein